jgi:TonB family protein
MRSRLSRLLRGRPLRGLAASLAIHAVLIGLALMASLPAGRFDVKRGEPLFVELPDSPEPPSRGNPAARRLGPAVPEAPRPAPPAPVAQSVPPPAPAPEPEPPAVAGPPPPPVARAPESPPPAPPPARAPAPVPSPPVAADPEPARPEPMVPATPVAPATPAPAEPIPAPPRVAAVPPVEEAPAVDIRSALGRGGGAGSAQGGGRGGIEGEPIPLDSSDGRYNDYMDRLRREIKSHWGFPCVKSEATRECEYKTTSLVIEFGILKDGRLQFVDVVESSGFPIYDDYAVNAIKLASPFPPVPPAVMAAMNRTSVGAAILARFNYVVDTSLTNLIR